MDVPAIVRERVGDESVVGGVDLDGDVVLVTPTRTLVYRAEGLLSDESVAEFPHDVQRVELREGRRKATFRYAYVDGTREFSVPVGRVDDLLEPLLWGVLYAAGVVDGDETVEGAYRFSELTFVVTEARAVKHVGSALWDDEFEQFPYDGLTDLDFEEGSVATAIVFGLGGRRERVKAPNERAGVVRRAVEEAVLEYHGVDSLEAFRAAVDDEDEESADGSESGTDAFGTPGFEPLVDDGGDPDATAGGGAGGGGGVDAGASGATPGGGPDADTSPDATLRVDDEAAVAEQLAALTEAVRRQNELLERQQATVEQLIEELRRGR